MSTRLTKEWTPSLEEAFGHSGKLGREAELFVSKVISSWGWDVIDHESEIDQQLAGIDISIKKPTWLNYYTVDVKGNLTYDGGIPIETDTRGWLFNPKKTSDRIWHVNVTTGWMAWYGRQEMKNWIVSKGLQDTGLYTLPANNRLHFITRRKHS